MGQWHQILGNVSINSIKMLKNNNLVTGLEVDGLDEPSQCKACIQGKWHMKPFPKRTEDMVDQVGDVTISNVWGPAQTKGPSSEQYFYSFTDIKSRYSVIYFGSAKDGVLGHFELYKVFIEAQMGHKLKKFHSDNGGEYSILTRTLKIFMHAISRINHLHQHLEVT